MGMIGTIGNLALIREKPDFAIKNVALIKHTGAIDYKFLYQILQSSYITNQLQNGIDGGTQKFIALNKIRGLDISFPNEEEQYVIGAYFEHLDKLITLHQRKFFNCYMNFQLILINLFYSWEQRKAKELCSITTGKSNTQDQSDEGIYPFFIRSDIPVKSKKYLYDQEAVITIGDGNIGKVFHYVNGKFDLHQRCYKMADFKHISAKYFYWYFSTKFYKRAISMTAKATVDSVRLEMISEMDIKYPCSSREQNLIQSFLFNIDNLITLHQRQEFSIKDKKFFVRQKVYCAIKSFQCKITS